MQQEIEWAFLQEALLAPFAVLLLIVTLTLLTGIKLVTDSVSLRFDAT